MVGVFLYHDGVSIETALTSAFGSDYFRPGHLDVQHSRVDI